MKKILIAVAAIAALTLAGCTKEQGTGKQVKGEESFSKAEISFSITGGEGTGDASDEFWNQMNQVRMIIFKGDDDTVVDLTKAKPSYTVEINETPTAEKSIFYRIQAFGFCLEAPSTSTSADFNVKLTGKWVIYDKKNKVLKEETFLGHAYNGVMSATEFSREFNATFFSTEFELAYCQNAITGKWMYNFGLNSWDYHG